MALHWHPVAIVATARYRVDGGEWTDATVLEMNRFGVVIRTLHQPPPLAAHIDLRVTLAWSDEARRPEIACSGLVTSAPRAGAAGGWLIGVALIE